MGVEYRHYVLPRDRRFAPDAARVARLVETLRVERWVLVTGHPLLSESHPDGIPAYGATGASAFRTAPNPIAPRRQPLADVAIPVPMPVTAAWIDALGDELSIVFPLAVPDDGGAITFEEHGVRYPILAEEEGAQGPYHDVVIELSRDYVHPASEGVDPIDTRCACGVDLEYSSFDAAVTGAICVDARIRSSCPGCGASFDPSGRLARLRDGWTGEDLAPLDGGAVHRFALIVDCHKGWPRDAGALRLDPELVALVSRVLEQPMVDFGDFH